MKVKKHTLNTEKFCDLKVFGILSQKKSHELMLQLTNALEAPFTKSKTDEYQSYFSAQENLYYFLIKNSPENLFSIFSVDYVLVVANSPENADEFKNRVQKMQKNGTLLGFYELKLQAKFKTQAKELLDALLQ